LVDWLFTVLRPAQEFFTSMETSRHHCRWRAGKFFRLMLVAQGLSLTCHTCCDTGPRLFRSHPKDCTICRLLRHTRGCGGSILTRILTGVFNFEWRAGRDL
jgi:hypothetical protein